VKIDDALAEVVEAFIRHKLLLLSDAAFPNVVQIVTNETVSGSWWGHPMGKVIYAVCGRLEDRDDALILKLISKKVTFVERDLWASVVSLGEAKLDWQLKKLQTSCRDLLSRVEEAETFYVLANATERKCAKELEVRLLCISRDEHTPTGAHRKILIGWRQWRIQNNFREKKDIAAAALELETRLSALNSKFRGSGTFPWT